MGVAQSDPKEVSPANRGRSKCAMASGSQTPQGKVYVPGSTDKFYWLENPDKVDFLFDRVVGEPPKCDKPKEEKKDEKKGDEKKGDEKKSDDKKAGDGKPKDDKPKECKKDPCGRTSCDKGECKYCQASGPPLRITYARYTEKAADVKPFLPFVEDESAEINKANAEKFKKVFAGDEKDGGLTFAQFKLNWAAEFGSLYDPVEEKKKADEAAAKKKAEEEAAKAKDANKTTTTTTTTAPNTASSSSTGSSDASTTTTKK